MKAYIEVIGVYRPSPVTKHIFGDTTHVLNGLYDGNIINKVQSIKVQSTNIKGVVLLPTITVQVGLKWTPLFKKIPLIETVSVKKPINKFEDNLIVYVNCYNEDWEYQKFSMSYKKQIMVYKDIPDRFPEEMPQASNALNGFNVTTQKNVYMEFALDIDRASIRAISGLPQGLFFDSGVIRGTPNISGKFDISIVLSSDSLITGIINVPEIQRNF